MLILAIGVFLTIILLLDLKDFSKFIGAFVIYYTVLSVLIYIFISLSFAIIKPDSKNIVDRENTLILPFVRNDLETIEQLVSDINEQSPGENGTYVAVGEYLLNSDTLRNAHMPESLNSVPSLSPVSDVDLRDGFPKFFLSATCVVACNSENCTYNKGEEILRYINNSICDDVSAIGKHYKRISSYTIVSGLQIDLYEKISEYSKEDLEIIAKHFDEVYPHHEGMFRDVIMGKIN